MCTVTFSPTSQENFILISNRDESPGRETLPPSIYQEEGVKLLYPKDVLAGGTWIGISENKRAVTLMNGGFVSHRRKPYYRKSRGLVVKDFLEARTFELLLDNYDFLDIEPFTSVVADWNGKLKLFTIVWDGAKLHKIQEPLMPKIWSSSPLYPEDARLLREVWFSDFKNKQQDVAMNSLLHFHKTAGEGNPKNYLIMDRGFVKTKSITAIEKDEGLLKMRYEDLQTSRITEMDFQV